MKINDLIKHLELSNIEREKLIRLSTSTFEFLEYLVEHAKKHKIPIPKNLRFYMSQIETDWEDCKGDDFNSGFNNDSDSTVDLTEPPRGFCQLID